MNEKRAIELTYEIWQYIHDNIEEIVEEIERGDDRCISVTVVKMIVLKNIEISVHENNTIAANFYCPCCVVWRKVLENGDGIDCTGCAGIDLWGGDLELEAPCESEHSLYLMFAAYLDDYGMYGDNLLIAKKHAGAIAEYFKKLMEDGK